MKKNILIIAFIFLLLMTSCSGSKIKDWDLNYISIEKLWNYSKGNGQTIAFIDTGLSPAAVNLYKNRIVNGFNVIDNSRDITDNNGHGTKIVSIASGNGYSKSNAYGVYGIAPESRIMPIKAVTDNGKMENDVLCKAIDYAINKGATIINLSLGGQISNKSVINKINNAISKNVTVIAAAGDYGDKDLLFPANINNVISVEAKNQKGNIWENSNISTKCIMAMPGENIKELSPFDNTLSTTEDSGTSQATALASGYIALLRDYYSAHHVKYNNTYLIKKLKQLKSTQNQDVDYTMPFK